MKKPTYLFVLASTNQLYSGTGRAIFDWIRFSKRHFRFTVLIDNHIKHNVEICRAFCGREGVDFLLSEPAPRDTGPDPGVRDIEKYLKHEKWSYVEVVSWANTLTNLDVLESISPGTRLFFTPHTQPVWTLPPEYRRPLIEPVFDRVLRRADLVFCDSEHERHTLHSRLQGAARLVYIPLGVDPLSFFPEEHILREKQILTVCDFREPRKRADLLFGALKVIAAEIPNLRFVLGGMGSETVDVPDLLQGRVRREGYVVQEQLVHLYQTSALFMLLSDYEAFGLPIAEALSCGTPVVITDTAELHSLFAGQPGVYLENNQNPTEILAAVRSAMDSGISPGAIAAAAQQRFGLDCTYGKKLAVIQNLGS